MKLGFIGLGKMGINMVLRLQEHHINVVCWNRSEGPRHEAKAVGLEVVDSLDALVQSLPVPRIIWLMLTAGPAVDEVIKTLLPSLNQGDIIVDGGNSLYKDSIRRFGTLESKGIHFIDVGVSGGPHGARTGACLMVGGEASVFEHIEPIIKVMSAPNAYKHLGTVGAGHFAKMVHNGIEYGMMQAIAEGAAVLREGGFDYDLADVFDLYNNGSVIESRLVKWAQQAFIADPTLDDISSKIKHNGEGQWTIEAAKELGVDVPVIEKSFQMRLESSEESNSFRDKVVSALRGQFGGHDVKKSS